MKNPDLFDQIRALDPERGQTPGPAKASDPMLQAIIGLDSTVGPAAATVPGLPGKVARPADQGTSGRKQRQPSAGHRPLTLRWRIGPAGVAAVATVGFSVAVVTMLPASDGVRPGSASLTPDPSDGAVAEPAVDPDPSTALNSTASTGWWAVLIPADLKLTELGLISEDGVVSAVAVEVPLEPTASIDGVIRRPDPAPDCEQKAVSLGSGNAAPVEADCQAQPSQDRYYFHGFPKVLEGADSPSQWALGAFPAGRYRYDIVSLKSTGGFAGESNPINVALAAAQATVEDARYAVLSDGDHQTGAERSVIVGRGGDDLKGVSATRRDGTTVEASLGGGWWMLLPPAVDEQDITVTLTWANGTTTTAPVHLAETYSEGNPTDPEATENYPGFVVSH